MKRSKGLLSREAIAAACTYHVYITRGVAHAYEYGAISPSPWPAGRPAMHGVIDRSTGRPCTISGSDMYHIMSSTLFRRPRTTSAMAEHRTMLQCTSSLTGLLQHNLTSVSAKLLARGLITDEVSDWMLTAQGVSNRDKAQRMVSCVTDRVKGSPQRFQSFVDVLNEEPYFEEVVQKLTMTYNNSGMSK